MEISLFEVDSSFIPTPLVSVPLRERGLEGSHHGGSAPALALICRRFLHLALSVLTAHGSPAGMQGFGVKKLLQPCLGSI